MGCGGACHHVPQKCSRASTLQEPDAAKHPKYPPPPAHLPPPWQGTGSSHTGLPAALSGLGFCSAGRSECDCSPTHPLRPPQDTVALPRHDQCASRAYFANTRQLHGAGSTLGTLTMSPIPCPEGCGTQGPLQGHRGAAQAMRVSHRWRWSPQGQADGGHRDTSHVLPQGPAPTHTHTLELHHI